MRAAHGVPPDAAIGLDRHHRTFGEAAVRLQAQLAAQRPGVEQVDGAGHLHGEVPARGEVRAGEGDLEVLAALATFGQGSLRGLSARGVARSGGGFQGGGSGGGVGGVVGLCGAVDVAAGGDHDQHQAHRCGRHDEGLDRRGALLVSGVDEQHPGQSAPQTQAEVRSGRSVHWANLSTGAVAREVTGPLSHGISEGTWTVTVTEAWVGLREALTLAAQDRRLAVVDVSPCPRPARGRGAVPACGGHGTLPGSGFGHALGVEPDAVLHQRGEQQEQGDRHDQELHASGAELVAAPMSRRHPGLAFSARSHRPAMGGHAAWPCRGSPPSTPSPDRQSGSCGPHGWAAWSDRLSRPACPPGSWRRP